VYVSQRTDYNISSLTGLNPDYFIFELYFLKVIKCSNLMKFFYYFLCNLTYPKNVPKKTVEYESSDISENDVPVSLHISAPEVKLKQ
jgi:hypothetical protein